MVATGHWSLIFRCAFVELPGLLVAFWVRKVHKSSPQPWDLEGRCCTFAGWFGGNFGEKHGGELRQLLADTGCAHLAVGNLWNLR